MRSRILPRAATTVAIPVLALTLALAGCSTDRTFEAAAAFGAEQGVATQSPLASDGERAALRVAIIGDSFTTGYGASSDAYRWSSVLCDELGWHELNFGVPGANYASPGDDDLTYVDLVPLVAESTPDLVLVTGGTNTYGIDQADGVRETLSGLRARLPHTPIVVLTPFHEPGEDTDEVDAVRDSVIEDASQFDIRVADPGNPLGDDAEYYAPFDTHPNDEGYALMASSVRQALEDVLSPTDLQRD